MIPFVILMISNYVIASIQLNYNRMHDLNNYDKTFQENYGELIIENSNLVYKLYIDLTNCY